MVNVDKAIIARLKAHGANFEVLVDCKNAILLREGNEVDMADVLAAQEIFSDAGKGLRAAEAQLKQAFSTVDPVQVAKQIIAKGDIQLTAEYRAELREQKKKQVLTALHRNGVDPKTGLPHPMKRLELAIAEARVHIDEFKSVEVQVQDIIKQLRPVLPISFEKRKIEVVLNAEVASKAYGALAGFGTKLKDEWKNDGSYVVVLEIPAGLQEEFFDRLNSLTRGNHETTLLKE